MPLMPDLHNFSLIHTLDTRTPAIQRTAIELKGMIGPDGINRMDTIMSLSSGSMMDGFCFRNSDRRILSSWTVPRNVFWRIIIDHVNNGARVFDGSQSNLHALSGPRLIHPKSSRR